jgi:hypothetical protein
MIRLWVNLSKTIIMDSVRKQNPLIAVFWDYPEYTDDNKLRQSLADNTDNDFRQWAAHRFLEHGRVIDTLLYFSINEIADRLNNLHLRPCTREKWLRMIEVYGTTKRT